jgi:hypothetical protein
MNAGLGVPTPASGARRKVVAIFLRQQPIQPLKERLRLGVAQAVEQCTDQEVSAQRVPHDHESSDFCDVMFSSK